MGFSDVGIYLKGGPFSIDIGIVNKHPSKKTYWVLYINKKFFDSNGCAPPQNLSEIIMKRIGYCLSSEYKIQGLTSKRDSFFASYCLYIIYLTKVIGMDFKAAVLS